MKKIIITIGIIGVIILIFVFFLKTSRPSIVDIFACSDYCPEPREKYMIKVYKDVSDKEECQKLGGRPSSFTGWTTHNICIAE